MIVLDPETVLAARRGDRAALDSLLRATERPVYNLALRMLAHPADAEDATQEILIKIVTHLGTVRDVAAAGGWAMQVAFRHLVRERKRGRIEAMHLTFDDFAEDLVRDQTPLEDLGLSEGEAALAVREVKIGCTLAMLVCLSRDLRAAYILGDVFDLSDGEGAAILEISPAAYRQRLRRARAAVVAFTGTACGIASKAAPCRCDRRVGAALGHGRVTRGATAFAGSQPEIGPTELCDTVQALESSRAATALMRSNPDFHSTVKDMVLRLVDSGQTSAQNREV